MMLRCLASSRSGSKSVGGAAASSGVRDPFSTIFMRCTRYPARRAGSKSPRSGSVPDELRFAGPLFDEGAHTDLLVLGREQVHEDLALDQEAVLEVGLKPPVDRDLRG